MTSALDWSHTTSTIGERGITETRTASPEELAEIARALDIVSAERFTATYEIKTLRKGHFRLKGTLEADVTQACILSLEPVQRQHAEDYSIELRPEADADDPEPTEGEIEILSLPDVEIYHDGRIEVGTLLVEILAAALDPYPKREGAEFDWVDPKAKGDDGKVNPFAVLAKLKPKD